jgi:hypothetical protein
MGSTFFKILKHEWNRLNLGCVGTSEAPMMEAEEIAKRRTNELI